MSRKSLRGSRRGRDGSGASADAFAEEDEAIEITRAELDKLRDKIDQARMDAGISSRSISRSSSRSRSRSRHGSRASSRAPSRSSSRRSMASTDSVDPDFADERSTTVGGSTAGGLSVENGGFGDMMGMFGEEKPPIWDEDELDTRRMKEETNAHQIGSAVVPKKVVEKYETAKLEYEKALKAKREKKDRLRRELAAQSKPASKVDELAAEFSRAITGDDPVKTVRKRMDYKKENQMRVKAARLAHAHKKVEPTFFVKMSSLLFGCCMRR